MICQKLPSLVNNIIRLESSCSQTKKMTMKVLYSAVRTRDEMYCHNGFGPR